MDHLSGIRPFLNGQTVDKTIQIKKKEGKKEQEEQEEEQEECFSYVKTADGCVRNVGGLVTVCDLLKHTCFKQN